MLWVTSADSRSCAAPTLVELEEAEPAAASSDLEQAFGMVVPAGAAPTFSQYQHGATGAMVLQCNGGAHGMADDHGLV